MLEIPTLSPEYIQAALLLEPPGWEIAQHSLVNRATKQIKHPYPYGNKLFDAAPDFIAAGWSAFYRLHPLVPNDVPYGELNRYTVAIDLSKPQYTDKCRNKIRKAKKAGLEVHSSPGVPEWFGKFYREGMVLLNARGFYHFNDAYFHALNRLPQAYTFEVHDKAGTIQSASIIIASQDVLEYHLAVTTNEGKLTGATNLLVAAVAEWGRGAKWFYLGGGKTADPEDPLFKFKASFSDTRLPFYTMEWPSMPSQK